MKHIKIKPIIGVEGNEPLSWDGVVLPSHQLLRKIILSCPANITPTRAYTLEDTDHAILFFNTVRECDGKVLNIEDHEYKWLHTLITILAPRVYRHNARQVIAALENLEEPKAKKE